MTYFKLAQKVVKYLGFFDKKICCREVLKIVQSGHTDSEQITTGRRRGGEIVCLLDGAVEVELRQACVSVTAVCESG